MAFLGRGSTRRKKAPKGSSPKVLKLFNTDSGVLGIGTYGTLYKAQCDDFPCAAKLLHPAFFEPTRKFSYKKFEQECEFMCSLKHPNIIQYYGTHQDPKSGLPMLLMELMDGNLTKFLEDMTQAIPYHIQLNLCHDVAMGLSHLHSLNIIHHSLSSNNVLLIGNSRAKLSDFSMSRICGLVPLQTSSSSGKEAYMPLEALRGKPVYTSKVDVFSLGVLIIQVLTRQFPRPGVGMKAVQIDHPHISNIDVNVSEVERRRNHINEVDPHHPLLPVSIGCLKDRSSERPTAQEICQKMAALKEREMYTESMKGRKHGDGQSDTSTPKKEEGEDPVKALELELQSQSEQHSQELDEFQQQFSQSISYLQQEHAYEIDTFQKKYDQDIESLQHQRMQQVKSLQHLLKTQYLNLQEKNVLAATQQEEIQTLQQQVSSQKWKYEEKIVSWKLENQQLKQELETVRQQLRERGKEMRVRETQFDQVMEQVRASEHEVLELKYHLSELEQLLSEDTEAAEHSGPKNGKEFI